jgi:hypothetical protein
MNDTRDIDRETRRAAGGIALACALLFALLAGCAQSSGDSDGKDDETKPPADPKTVVYAGGSYCDGGANMACYWKDGARVELPSGSTSGATVSAIAVSGGKVYSGGAIQAHETTACCWAGNEKTDLGGWGVEAIGVEGGTVYALVNGDWSAGGITAFGGAYYSGATLHRLKGIASGDPARPEHDTGANALAISGGTVYVAGRAAYSIYDSYACYWTGPDARTDLDAGSEAYAICVSGGTVYTAGRTVVAGKNVACYWTGATMTKLPALAGCEGYAEAIQVVGGTVYTAGYSQDASYNNFACYWVDGARHDLPGQGSNPSNAYGICVFEGSVYVSGSYNDGSKNVPCYWKDGARIDLPGGETDGTASDIVVVKE